MNLFYYLLEANAYLLVFCAFYKFLLQRETLYTLNRFYLLFTSLLAFILPCFTLSGLRHPHVDAPILYTVSVVQTTAIKIKPEFWTIPAICIALYLTVGLLFLVRLAFKLYQIFRLIKQNNVRYEDGIKKVEITGQQVSFSFLNYLFVNPQLSGLATITRHERVHIRQYHTIDILFFQLLQVINWFNPLIILLQKEIKALHEFIADEETLNNEISSESYSMFLIDHSYHSAYQSLGNQMFSQHLLKERILRLYQQRSARSAKLKYLLIIPFLLLMPCVSSMAFAKSYGIFDLMPQEKQAVNPVRNFNPENTDRKESLKTSVTPVTASLKLKTTKSNDMSAQPKLEEYASINIDARTDTVKIRTAPSKVANTFKGIYVVDDKIYTNDELRKALKPTGKLDIILPNRPAIGYVTENDAGAIKMWGERAKNGVMFVRSRRDTTIATK
jgi:beta-lactamase regulating signal transducer with metallopeptidase domain